MNNSECEIRQESDLRSKYGKAQQDSRLKKELHITCIMLILEIFKITSVP